MSCPDSERPPLRTSDRLLCPDDSYRVSLGNKLRIKAVGAREPMEGGGSHVTRSMLEPITSRLDAPQHALKARGRTRLGPTCAGMREEAGLQQWLWGPFGAIG